MGKIVVIIPTYNERDFIGALIDSIKKECQTIKSLSLHILIVDGNSPDSTADVVRQKINIYDNVHLLVEKEKRGLGMAYIDGINYALQKLHADAFIEFDGDFQHNPKDIIRLITAYEEGYDYVIGSRYIAGGEIPRKWAWYRKFLSCCGSACIRHILQLPTRDNTSGLKLTRVHGFADKLPLSKDQILSQRHAYKIHLLYEMIQLNAKIKEIPIVFLEREGGASKSSFEDIFESLKVILFLTFKRISLVVLYSINMFASRFSRIFAGGICVVTLSIASVLMTKGFSKPFVPDAPSYRQKGRASAKIVIVEYSDFQCPVCRLAQDPLQKIFALYGDDIRFLYKHYPLERIHPFARAAAAAAECAGFQDKFWPFHDRLYANQEQWTGPQAADWFKTYAQQIGLNDAAFNACLAGSTVQAAIAADKKQADDHWVNATPTFFINGKRFVGPRQLSSKAPPFIDQEMKR